MPILDSLGIGDKGTHLRIVFIIIFFLSMCLATAQGLGGTRHWPNFALASKVVTGKADLSFTYGYDANKYYTGDR